MSPLLRGAALPGAAAILRAGGASRACSTACGGAAIACASGGSGPASTSRPIARALRPLERAGARKAFIQTLRSVIDVHGQRVSARDRVYLLRRFPTLIVWGERDNTIPLAHGEAAHHAIPGSHFLTLPSAAHFPHLEDPDRPGHGAR